MKGWTSRLFLMIKSDKGGMYIDRVVLGGNIGRDARHRKGLKMVHGVLRVEVIAAEGDDQEEADEYLLSRVPMFRDYIEED